ncbi:MAG TPA: protein-export chaperone SecB [Thioalkalivibrio sp.]|nr:protein-export chaperone SecB [Thioalkalivibrio sp.]
MTDQDQTPAAAGSEQAPAFGLQKIYLKDVSFESPNAPAVYLAEWKPEHQVQLTTEVRPLEDDNHEVVLNITVTVKNGETTAYLVEIKQAGIFLVRNYSDEQKGPLLGSLAPATLFPYAREAIANLVQKGGFPELVLQPINFDALFAQHVKRAQEQAAAQASH